MNPSISARGVCVSVGVGKTSTDVLTDCTLDLRGPGMTAVVGHSGSGKTSLLLALSGLSRPTSGSVLINDTDVYRQSANKRAAMLRTELAFVFQQYNLVPFLTVEENIALPFLLGRVRVPRDLIADLIESFGLSHQRSTPARSLSGGEQQRTALCRALAQRPAIVFADEPTGALDSQSSLVVLRTLRRMADDGHLVVVVTHDLEAAAVADSVVVMHDGSVAAELGPSTSEELLSTLSGIRA